MTLPRGSWTTGVVPDSPLDDDPTDVDGGSGDDALDERTQELLGRAQGVEKPIADTHVHLYRRSRPGVVWPEPTNEILYQDYLPERYMELALDLGILGSGIVEASPFIDDTQWVLAQVAADEATDAFYPWYVAQLDISSADFVRNLDAYLTVDEATNPGGAPLIGLLAIAPILVAVGAVVTAEVVVPRMIAAGRGHLIGISSQADRLIDGAAPNTSRWVIGLVAMLVLFVTFSVWGMVTLLRPAVSMRG